MLTRATRSASLAGIAHRSAPQVEPEPVFGLMADLRGAKPEDIDYRIVVDSAPALVFSARSDGHIDYFNHRWFEYLGVTLSELEGSGWTNFIHPDDLEEHVRRWRTSMSDGQPAVSQARVRNAKGEYRWMLHRTEPLRDDDGNIVRWFGTSIDIEELKRRPTAGKGVLGRRSVREETGLIESALAGSRGRVAGPDGAAAKLGIPRSTLESRIRSLYIDKNRFKSR